MPTQDRPDTSPTPPAPADGPRRRRRLTGLQPLVVGVAAALVVGFGAGLGSGALAWHSPSPAQASSKHDESEADADVVDATAKQKQRVRADEVPKAVKQLEESGFEPVHKGQLTVAATSTEAPLVFHAEDGSTVVGSEVDVAQLIADGLGLDLKVEATNWADWPLGVQSGKYDLVVSNVGVTEERKELFDFATYRHGLHSFLVRKDSGIKKLGRPGDVAGKKIVVSAGTNQDKILQTWSESNQKAGLEPAELKYYDDTAAGVMALKSGRVDAFFGPNPNQIYEAQVDGDLQVKGQVNAGWPDNTDVGTVTAKGNGLNTPVATVLRHTLRSGELKKSLQRWDLQDEAVDHIRINPPGTPKPKKK